MTDLSTAQAASIANNSEHQGSTTTPGVRELKRLTTLAGELVIAQCRLSHVAARLKAPELTAHLKQTRSLITELNDRLLNLRNTSMGPLTSAIVDGLLIEIGSERYLVLTSLVSETLELPRTVRVPSNGSGVSTIRGEMIPCIPLRDAFEVTGDLPAVQQLVIVRYHNESVGLIVDRVAGTQTVCLQALEPACGLTPAFSAAAVIADGRVALVIDIGGLLQVADRPATLAAAR
jgi:chemotaxis protein histidine kinase CheA